MKRYHEGDFRERFVLPGEILADSGRAGAFAYRQGSKVVAATTGLRYEQRGTWGVIPLKGVYRAEMADEVIGIVKDMGPSHWILDINAALPAPLHVNDVPWRVEFGDTGRYLAMGDVVLVKVSVVEGGGKVMVSLKDQGLRRLSGGFVVDLNPLHVPRLIGRGGSMITMIKNRTKCRITIGRNGRVWIDGAPKDISAVVKAINIIDAEGVVYGLGDQVRDTLEEHYGK